MWRRDIIRSSVLDTGRRGESIALRESTRRAEMSYFMHVVVLCQVQRKTEIRNSGAEVIAHCVLSPLSPRQRLQRALNAMATQKDAPQMMDELDLLLGRQPVWDGQRDVQPENKRISAIPPKIVFHIFVHEEVTALNNHVDSTSDVMIDGVINVKLISSDASSNIPFQLLASSLQQGSVNLNYNKTVTISDGDNTFVKIPKSLRGKIKVADYRIITENETMPFLIERQLSRTGRKGEKYLLSIKVQSRIGNGLDQSVFKIAAAVAIPPTVVGSSLEIVKGSSFTSFDELRRMLKFKIPSLREDQDYVEIQAVFDGIPSLDVALDEQKFPLLLRCESMETIMSDIALGLQHSDTIKGASVIQHKSFKLWYRLN